MKKSKIIISSVLSCLLAFGAILGIKTNKSSLKDTEIVDATAVPTGIYVEISTTSSWYGWGATLANISVYFFGGDYGDPSFDVKYPVDTSTGYVAVPEHEGIRPVNCIVCCWGGGNNNQSNDLTLDTDGYCKFVASGEVSGGKQGGFWTNYSGITTEFVYIDATNWVSGMGDSIPYCHYWDNQYIYDNVPGENIDYTDRGTTCENTKWWRFELRYRDSGSLNFLFMYNNYAMQTGNIAYSRNNAFYLSGVKDDAPLDSFACYGYLCQVTRYKKVGSSSSTELGTDFLLSGESYQAPSLPGAESGYDTPTSWNTNESGTGTAYTPSSWINDLDRSISLYAIYTDAVYTITYDRNLNTGLQATQSKDRDVNVNAYTPGTAPLGASGWNPSQFKRFVHWNTSYDDKGTTVNANGVIASNASFMLYYIEDWYNYRYKINNGSYIYLTYNNIDIPSGVTAQFKSSAQTLPLNGTLSFEYSTDGGTNWSALTVSSYEGNYDVETGIKMQTTDSLYLKANNNGTYTVWVPGISDRYVSICESWDSTSGIPFSMVSDGYTQTKTPSPINVNKNKYLRLGYCGELHETYLANEYSNFFCQINDDDAVECLLTGAYMVYNQAGTYNNWHDIYITRDEEASAKYLAQMFNDAVSTICSGITSGVKSLSDLQAIWGSTTTSTLYNHFNNQTVATMNYFKTTSTTTDEDILDCVELYDYIVRKYGTTALPDFLERSNGYRADPQSAIKIALLSNSIDSSYMILTIAAISIVSISSVGGYFYLRKRKQK